MDVLTLHQFGFTNAVGVLGTAFTDNHVYQLARFTEKVYMLFDSDAAGINAALRSAPKVLSSDFETYVIRLLKTKDADDFLHKFGAPGLTERIKDAHPLMGFIRKLLIFRHKDKNPSWKSDVVGEIRPFINAIGSAVTREEEIKKTASALDVSAAAIEKELSKSSERVYTDNDSGNGQGSNLQKKKKLEKGQKIEREIICFLVNYPELVDVFRKAIKPEDFKFRGDFLKSVYESFDSGEDISVSNLISKFSQAAASLDESDFIAELTAAVIKNDAPASGSPPAGVAGKSLPLGRQAPIGAAGSPPAGADKKQILRKKKEAENLVKDFKKCDSSAKVPKLRKKFFEGNLGAAPDEELKEYMKAAIQRDRKRQGGHFEKDRRQNQR